MMDETNDERPAVERLAEEIRRGVREAVPDAPEAAGGTATPGSNAWTAAERYIVPAVQPGASLTFLKKAILRVLRIVTRSQGTFNAKMLEGARGLERSLTMMRREWEDARRLLDQYGRENDVLQARMATYEAPSSGRAPSLRAEPPPISEGLYARFEEAFRGSQEAIRERQRAYVEFFRDAPGPVVDCGCGRGEFVGILLEAGIPGEGIDSNRIAVSLAERQGLPVRAGDAFERLQAAHGELGGVAALQFVEHLDPPAVGEFLRLAFGALAPGGRLLLETINPDSLYAMRAYRLDPTHRWPVPAATLSLFVRHAGFVEKEIRFLSPVPPGEALAEVGENERKLNRWIFGFQDYALFAERPRA